MTKPTFPIEGHCRCSRVRVRITEVPLMTMACHCRGCQHMSASAFSLSAAIPAEGFAIVAGEPVIGGLHGPTRHYFCEWCKSWMYTRPEGMDHFVNLRPTMLADSSWFRPFIETFTETRLAGVQTGAIHAFLQMPDMPALEALTLAYLDWAPPAR